jgi:hypothetical protein
VSYEGAIARLQDQPAFIVFRAARGVPPGWMPPDLEGRWYTREQVFGAPEASLFSPPGAAVAIPTTRTEQRQDGAMAQVWEVHPRGGNYANDGDPGDLS